MVKHILLAVDDSPASARVAEYVGGMLQIDPHGRRKRDNVRITILHIYPRTLQSQYATGQALAHDLHMPHYEYALEADHDVAVHAHKIRRPTDDAREQLLELGVPHNAIDVHHKQAGPAADVAAMIIATAKKYGCDTIAVGRNRDQRFLRTHISDAVIKRSQDLAVWVVH